MSKKKKKILIIIISLILIFITGFNIYRHIEVNPEVKSEYVHAIKDKIYDGDENELIFRGTNIGNWLVPEGWMGLTEINGQNDDVEGEKLTYKKLIAALERNSLVDNDKIDDLLKIHYDNFFTREDVKFLKESGFNVIRLPFLYYNLYDENDNLKEDAYYYLDKAIEWCEEFGMYVILDCHGASSTQNQEHHSGDDSVSTIFDDEEEQAKTIHMWVEIAKRYKDVKCIAGYGLLNEPRGNGETTKNKHFRFIEKIYDAIREVDKNHMLIIGACWSFFNIKNPVYYGFENVLYEFHLYTFNMKWAGIGFYMNLQELTYKLCSYRNVPIYIGEFALGDSYEDLKYFIDFLESRDRGWTSWTYKTNNMGNWAMINMWKDRINVETASYDEIAEAWRNQRSDFNNKSDAYKNLMGVLEELDK